MNKKYRANNDCEIEGQRSGGQEGVLSKQDETDSTIIILTVQR